MSKAKKPPRAPAYQLDEVRVYRNMTRENIFTAYGRVGPGDTIMVKGLLDEFPGLTLLEAIEP